MRPNFDSQAFRTAIEADVSKAYSLISELEYQDMVASHEAEEPYGEERALTEMELRDMLMSVHERLAFALEYLGMDAALDRVGRRFAARESRLTELETIPHVDVLYSPALAELVAAYRSLLGCFDASPEPGTSEFALKRDSELLRQVLLGTPKLIADRKLDPKNESEVKREVYGVLLHVFPDTVRELPIPQASKTYKADIGVPHLRTAVEYKFCDTDAELKAALGGIYEDTKGYGGSLDWTRFVAVIYCTDVFITDAQLREELRRVGMPPAWEVVLVTGRGHRERRGRPNSLPKGAL